MTVVDSSRRTPAVALILSGIAILVVTLGYFGAHTHYVLVSDVARYYVVVVSFWMLVLLGRMIKARIVDYGWRRALTDATIPPHVWTLAGFAGFMLIATARRFDNLGQPGDVYLWAVTASVTAMLVGAFFNWRFDLRPPNRRPDRAPSR